ncbi:type I pullulanase [Macrococcus armenti]|uniref:Type I pullulanase n=1 Tax=Macrococcus armenti TaxID=2875764 RepID=A0ABY3ZWR1_9STAP|nr:type I pullulanase [Macrococcus armenti]UOB21340.1 type I pullulanase [Macrococcus armenti]
MIQAYIDDFSLITFISDKPLTKTPVLIHDRSNKMKEIHIIHTEKYIQKFELSRPIQLNKVNFVEYDNEIYPLYIGAITRTETFEQKYDATEETLGATVHENNTTFSVWSPVAQSIRVMTAQGAYNMQRKQNGTYTVSVPKNLHGVSYQYEVTMNHQVKYINDPYAKGLTLNGNKSIVIDFQQIKSFDSTFMQTQKEDVSIYELHVRDFSMHPNSGIKHAGKLIGLIEENTKTNTGHTTGFDYIKSLGVSHIELLPINDFARVDDIHFEEHYNWGYDPEYYQTIDGSYSVVPDNPVVRIEELKQVIQKYHQSGIGVILDVVFNHVFKRETSPFEQLVPGYYFRYHDDGTLSNGTGVGNDIKTERIMMRKFILDTIDYYMDTFKIDGFRFDLMGVIDITTMQLIEKRTQEKNPYSFLLGEGWHLNSAMPDILKTTHDKARLVKNIHFFNDEFRDTLKGNNFYLKDRGYFNGKGRYYERMFQLFTGNRSVIPAQQSINYVEVHDNHTLFDRINFTTHKDIEYQHRIHQMATIFTILAHGTPFIHAGQEFYRTKYGHGNTYNLSDFINRIDWNRRIKYDSHIRCITKALQIKKQFPVFKSHNYLKRIIQLNIEQPLLGILLFDRKTEFILLFNPTKLNHTINIPRNGTFEISLSNVKTDIGSIQDEVTLLPYQFILLKKEL